MPANENMRGRIGDIVLFGMLASLVAALAFVPMAPLFWGVR